MAYMIAIDPGDVHVGVAFFECDEPDWWKTAPEDWRCSDTQEFAPPEFADSLAESLFDNDLSVVVFERFRLYGDKSAEQTGSEFETSQLIGVIKFLVRTRNAHAARHDAAETGNYILSCEQVGGWCAKPENRPEPVHLVGQMADIKKPCAGILRHKGIKSLAKANGDKLGHQVDAELHGWYWLFNKDK